MAYTAVIIMQAIDGYLQLHWLSSQVPDWRADRGKRHILSEVIFVMILALIAGAQNCEDIWRFAKGNEEWLRTILRLPHGIPSHDMYLRVLSAVPAEEFERLARAWATALRGPEALSVEGKQVALDGQTLRGSLDRASGDSPVHMVSAYLTEAGLTLGSVAVDEKSNEIKALPELMRSLTLQGATVTIDSMGCQREIAATAREMGAHYQLQVKGNQPILRKNIEDSLSEAARRRKPGEKRTSELEKYQDVDKGHGRIETRTCLLSRDLSGIERPEDWSGLTGIASVLRERMDAISGKTTREISLYILSDPNATARDVERMARAHWGIENGLHWTMDMVWGSDAHTLRDRNAAQNMSRLRRFCAGLVKACVGWGYSQRGVRMACGWNPSNLLRVLRGELIEGKPSKVMPVKKRKAQEAAAKAAKKK